MPYRRDGDWAQQIPNQRRQLPYEDYGWEAGESTLPEFRDPDVHRMPYEESWTPMWQQGPHAGKGPKGYKRSDERIYDDVCQRLMHSGSLDASDIEVKVDNGEVSLNGSVEDRGSKRLAEDIVDSVPGVQDVHNRLRIKSGGR